MLKSPREMCDTPTPHLPTIACLYTISYMTVHLRRADGSGEVVRPVFILSSLCVSDRTHVSEHVLQQQHLSEHVCSSSMRVSMICSSSMCQYALVVNDQYQQHQQS